MLGQVVQQTNITRAALTIFCSKPALGEGASCGCSSKGAICNEAEMFALYR